MHAGCVGKHVDACTHALCAACAHPRAIATHSPQAQIENRAVLVVRSIGEGGFSVIFEVKDTSTGAVYAVGVRGWWRLCLHACATRPACLMEAHTAPRTFRTPLALAAQLKNMRLGGEADIIREVQQEGECPGAGARKQACLHACCVEREMGAACSARTLCRSTPGACLRAVCKPSILSCRTLHSFHAAAGCHCSLTPPPVPYARAPAQALSWPSCATTPTSCACTPWRSRVAQVRVGCDGREEEALQQQQQQQQLVPAAIGWPRAPLWKWWGVQMH